MKDESKDLEIKKPNLPATMSQPIHDDDFEADDFSLAWLRIAAANSEVIQDPDKKIPGLEAGMFFNSMTQEPYGDKLEVVPLKFFRSYSAHEPGENGGFIRAVTPDEFKAGNWPRGGRGYTMPDGNQCREQFNYVVWLPGYPDAGILRLALGPGSFSAAKSWNTMIQTRSTPKHTQVWEIASVYNKAPDKTKSAFYAIGRGSAFAGRYLRQVDSDDIQAMEEMVLMVNATIGKILAARTTETSTNETDF